MQELLIKILFSVYFVSPLFFVGMITGIPFVAVGLVLIGASWVFYIIRKM